MRLFLKYEANGAAVFDGVVVLLSMFLVDNPLIKAKLIHTILLIEAIFRITLLQCPSQRVPFWKQRLLPPEKQRSAECAARFSSQKTKWKC